MMKKEDFKPGVVFREHLKFQSDRTDPALYRLVAIERPGILFPKPPALEIVEVSGNKKFTAIVLRADHFLAMMFVMGEAVVIKVRYENLERVDDADQLIKQV